MRTNAFVRDLDVPDANAGDGRRLEVVVDGLPLFGRWQLAVDTTLVCALHNDGRPRRGAAEMDGVALLTARRVKERRYPEFVGVQARARLVVLAVEVGGRFSEETNGFLTGLAKARARSETPLMQRRVEQAWRMRWSWLLGCAAVTAVAASLLEMQGCVGTDGASPAGHEVEGDFRHAGLAAQASVVQVFLGLCFTHFARISKKKTRDFLRHLTKARARQDVVPCLAWDGSRSMCRQDGCRL